MPWEVKKEGAQYCVFKSDTGKKMKCYNNKKEAEDYKGALYANASEQLEALQAIILENGGPTILGVAATNIPHLPLPEMSVVEINNKTLIRVPFLRKGIFSHPDGKLIFNDQIFSKMLDNHKTGKSHYGVSLNLRHKPELGALAWFDEKRGGTIKQEKDPEYGDLLVGYGVPTSDAVLDMVKNKQYLYASVEFHPAYKSNMVAKLSLDDLVEIQLEDLVEGINLEERNMSDVTISQEEYNVLKEKASKLEEMEAKMAEMESKMKKMTDNDEAENLPEPIRVKLEESDREIKRLQKKALATDIDLVITKAEAFRDESGKGHSPVLLEIVKKAMLGELIAVNDTENIKLESNTISDVADYFRKVFIHLLKVIPGQVQLESRTNGDNTPGFNQSSTFTTEDYKSFWGQ